MDQIPSVAVGAVVAALIAGTVSLLGLIISKEQKTSEFRQAWIDALRNDLITARIAGVVSVLGSNVLMPWPAMTDSPNHG